MFKVIWVCTTRRIYVKFFGPCCTRYNVRRRFRRRRWFGYLDRANLSSLNLAWSKIWSWCILVGWLGNVWVMGRIFIETIWWSLTLLLSRSESTIKSKRRWWWSSSRCLFVSTIDSHFDEFKVLSFSVCQSWLISCHLRNDLNLLIRVVQKYWGWSQ